MRQRISFTTHPLKLPSTYLKPSGCGLIKEQTKVIAGVPQKIYELPLDGAVSHDLADMDLTKMLDRVIIGPSQYGYTMYEAFVDALKVLGVSDATRRVVVSGIPIRR